MELEAYHEAGHALMALLVGGRVKHVSIAPEEDEMGRSGETVIHWPRRWSPEEVASRAVQVALAGPVAEMIYSGDPYHPGLLSAWAQDWTMALECVAQLPEGKREATGIAFLEALVGQLYRMLNAEPYWSALAALADHLLAHDVLEGPEIREVVAHWIE